MSLRVCPPHYGKVTLQEGDAGDEQEFDFPPSCSMLDLQLLDDSAPPPEYGDVVREKDKIRMFWRNSSLEEDAGEWRKRRVMEVTKLCKSLDLY